MIPAMAACGADAGAGGDDEGGGAAVDGGGGADGSIGSSSGSDAGSSGSSGGSDAGATGDAVATSSSSGGSSSSGSSSGGTKPTCTDDKGCDDGKACTTDTCKDGHCTWALAKDKCLIGGACYDEGAASKDGACKACDPAKPHQWSTAADGADCDDGEPCTHKGKCKAGGCVGEALKCDDANVCTTDVCKKGEGCTYPPVATSGGKPAPCDDGHACTEDDACAEGQCIASKLADCDDKNPCTNDTCDKSKGCNHKPLGKESACDDGDKCTHDDACKDGKCAAGGKANCDDGNACTIDVCEDFSGCGHLPTQNPCCTGVKNICNDGDPCTTDLCDPKTTKCDSKPNTAVCDDGDKCTTKDTCAKGKCTGQAAKCDDGNPCTKDACDPGKGCVQSPDNEAGTCNDGNPCTSKDVCKAGVCKGEGQCACTPKFSTVASRLNNVQIGNGGKPGEGLDLDGNSKTCSPKSSCSGGIDNSLGALSGLVNGPLQGAVDKGSLNISVEFGSYKQGPIELAVHQVDVHKSNPKCDINKAHCKYTAAMSLLDPKTCKPTVKLAGKLVGDKFSAGGKGTIFPFNLPIQPGVDLKVSIYDVRIEGTVKVSGGKLTSMTGILAGAVPKKDLLEAINAVPDADLPLPKATLISILDSTVAQDMDTNGDGNKDAASISLKIKGIGATLVDAK